MNHHNPDSDSDVQLPAAVPLAMVTHALGLLWQVLLARHPTLIGPTCPRDHDPIDLDLLVARRIAAAAWELQDALSAYRDGLEPDSDDIPF